MNMNINYKISKLKMPMSIKEKFQLKRTEHKKKMKSLIEIK